MTLAIYADTSDRHYWAETTSPLTLRLLASGTWTLFDATPDNPPPPGDPFDIKTASLFGSATATRTAADSRYPALVTGKVPDAKLPDRLQDPALRAAFASSGPTDPGLSLPHGTEYVWMKTDGAGILLDILSGVAS